MKSGKEPGKYKNFAPLYSKCDICERSWASTPNSQHHKNVKHVELVAPFCDTMSRNKRKVRRHMSKEHNDHGKLACKSCGTLFNEEKDLRVHVTSNLENNVDEKGNRLSTSMVSLITIKWSMVKVYKNKLGLSGAKLSRSWDLQFEFADYNCSLKFKLDIDV